MLSSLIPVVFMIAAYTHPTPPTLVAEAVIAKYVFLPVTLHGKVVTLLLDLGTNGDLILAQRALDRLDISLTSNTLDSLEIGKDVARNIPVEMLRGDVPFDGAPPPGFPPVIGYIGTKTLWRYDLLFNGPAHRVQLYRYASRFPRAVPLRSAEWFPRGITKTDCVSLTVVHDSSDHTVSFPLQVNGHTIPSFLDSGSDETTINLPAASILGFRESDPSVHLLPQDSTQSYPSIGPMKVWEWTGMRVTVAGKTLSVPDFRVAEHIPAPDETLPELDLGLTAIRDRLLWISYSMDRVCVSNRIPNRGVR